MNLPVRFRFGDRLRGGLAFALQNVVCGGFVRGMIANPILAGAHRIGSGDETEPKENCATRLSHP